MFDFVIALAVGFVGLFVVYTLFLSVSVSDNAPSLKAPRSSGKKAASAGAAASTSAKKGAAPSKKEQREEDAIIAAELRIANSGLNADSKKAEALTLDEIKERKRAKAAKKNADSTGGAAAQAAFTAKQAAAAKEEGFQIVVTPKEAAAAARPKSASPKVDANGREVLSRKEELDRKLGSFFRNNAKKGKRAEQDDKQESKVILKKSIGSVSEPVWKARAAAAAADE